MDGQRSLLLLGGSRQQVVAINKAKECGYRTVLCDYLPDNPGQLAADVFYQVSTTDRDAVLEVAKKEKVNGVIAYSSDPASPTAGYVAERLGLPTNPLSAIETMSEKHLFRAFLSENRFPCPQAYSFKMEADPTDVEKAISGFSRPIVVKPTDSSGSKGVSVLNDLECLGDVIQHASEYSRNGILIAEEYINRTFPSVVGGDIFVVDGEVRFWGLMSCLRDESCSLVPVGEKTPSGLNAFQLGNCKDVLQGLVTALGVRFGELNVEILIGDNDVPYLLELGSRAGGNMIPVQLADASGIDLVRANVMCAMGDDPGDISWEPSSEHCFTYVLHSRKDGIYRDLSLSNIAEAACYRRVMYRNPGSKVAQFDGANRALGILFFRFADGDKMESMIETIDTHVRVVVE